MLGYESPTTMQQFHQKMGSIDMSKFRNGDRIIGVGYSETLNIDGQRGKVARVSDSGNVLVVFDTKFSDQLHDNGGIGIHQCWWVSNHNCIVLEGEQVDKPPIKEGIVAIS